MRALMAVLGGVTVVGTLIWASIGPATAQAPSVEAGAELAARWCAGCHVVSPSGAGTDSAPSFAAIAAKHDADTIRDFLARPHATPMRGFNLNNREIADVAAYIESLGTPAH